MQKEKKPLKRVMLKEMHLGLWDEFVGIYEKLQTSKFDLVVILSCNGARVRLTFPADTAKIDPVKKELSSYKSGTRIGLLRTDEVSSPFLVRTIRT